MDALDHQAQRGPPRNGARRPGQTTAEIAELKAELAAAREQVQLVP